MMALRGGIGQHRGGLRGRGREGERRDQTLTSDERVDTATHLVEGEEFLEEAGAGRVAALPCARTKNARAVSRMRAGEHYPKRESAPTCAYADRAPQAPERRAP